MARARPPELSSKQRAVLTIIQRADAAKKPMPSLGALAEQAGLVAPDDRATPAVLGRTEVAATAVWDAQDEAIAILQSLSQRGLLETVPIRSNKYRWRITAAGRAFKGNPP